MALVSWGDRQVAKTWSGRDRQSTRHRVPQDTETALIDYERLKEINSLEGLRDKFNPQTSEEAHQHFMENYHKMFIKPKALPHVPKSKHELESYRSTSAVSTGHVSLGVCSKKHFSAEELTDRISHEIKDHMATLHRERDEVDPVVIQANRIKDLRRILRKKPFERTAAENELVFNHLKSFPELADQLTDKELKELSTVAQIDIWKDEDYTVFGNQGFHLILRGTVVPQSRPWLRSKDDRGIFRSPTPILTSTSSTQDMKVPELLVGDCFGTLQRVDGREPNSKILTVLTKQVPCEFLRISCSDYKRITEQIRIRETSEKVELIQSCPAYNLWPRQSLQKLAVLIDWITFPANTVLVSEGYKAPFIGFIKSGECHVLRQVEVMEKLPNGQQVKRKKQVVMGKLRNSESFGEISVLAHEPITCSIVTANNIEIGAITPARLQELDDTTRSLLQQSNTRTFGNLTNQAIHDEYVDQELKRQWNQFKHGVVIDVINSKGIRPGYGKWSK
ncbi:cyclic nucleotide-binding domain-containing protein 1-like [Ptychodera flava]|uniref:cyclic nucleotide-binding domain-containing protein 1-like n=1 Tax=Ptychodera flava TaxID=63121 RepID=UPI00396A0538